MIKGKIEVKGIEEYLRRVAEAGNNVDEAVKEAIQESTAPIQQDITEWVNKHRATGMVASGVIQPEVQQSGNEISAEVGISGTGESWHAVFVEYGSPRNKPADPGIRLAFETNLSKVKKIQREVLKSKGVPVDG